VVASLTSTERSQEELLRPLRTALTQMVLAGMPESKILTLVISELHLVGKGNK
jgi:hypothetical protein